MGQSLETIILDPAKAAPRRICPTSILIIMMMVVMMIGNEDYDDDHDGQGYLAPICPAPIMMMVIVMVIAASYGQQCVCNMSSLGDQIDHGGTMVLSSCDQTIRMAIYQTF